VNRWLKTNTWGSHPRPYSLKKYPAINAVSIEMEMLISTHYLVMIGTFNKFKNKKSPNRGFFLFNNFL
jgi:hypothetical protein